MNGITAARAAKTRRTSIALACLGAVVAFVTGPGRAEAAAPLSLSDLLAPTSGATVGELQVKPGLTGRGGELLSTGSLADVRVARTLAGGFTVGTAADTVSIRPLGRTGSRRVRLANRSAALFADAATATDVVIRPTATGVETFQRLRGPRAPHRFSWKVSIGPAQQLVPQPDGGIALVDYSARNDYANATDSGHVPPGSLDVPSPPPAGGGGGGLLGNLLTEGLIPPLVSQLLPVVPETIDALAASLDDAGAQLSGSYEAVNAAEEGMPDARVVGVFAAPWALDANGNEVPVSLTSRGSVVTLDVQPGPGTAYPVTADPAYSAGLATKAAAGEGAVPPGWERGTNLVSFLKEGYRQADNGGENAFTGLGPQQGVGTIVFTPTDYVNSTDPSSIIQNYSAYGSKKNESDASVREASCAARLGGVKRRYGGPGGYSVALKPHIDMTDGSFRGYIDPRGGNLDSFWSQYRDLLLSQARLAIQIHATTLVVGTELTALSDDPADEARWRQLISDIRGVTAQRYKCKRPGKERPTKGQVSFADSGIRLTFAANWDAIDRIRFWDALDMIGADYYENGTDMGRIWSIVNGIENQLQASGAGMKPFIFTEIGYDGNSDPAGFNQGSADANQNAMYWNAFSGWIEAYNSGKAPWFSGFWWWDRYAQGGGGEWQSVRDDFTPGPSTMGTQCSFQCPAMLSTIR